MTVASVEVYEAAVALLRQELTHNLGDRLRSLMLYGSCATRGPYWSGSDIDLVLVAKDDGGVNAEFLNNVAAAERTVAKTFGISISAPVGRWDDLRLIWSPTTMKALADNAVCILGQDLRPLLWAEIDRFQTADFVRGALRSLLFERHGLRERFMKLLVSLPDGSQPSDSLALRGIWKAYVNASRFATWTFTKPTSRLVSSLEEVFDLFEILFANDLTATFPRRVFAAMRETKPQPSDFTAQVLEACDQLADVCVCAFTRLTGEPVPFVDPI
jgi:hypothetical protein